MEAKKKGNYWTAFYDPETNRYFAEIMYISREGMEDYKYENKIAFTVREKDGYKDITFKELLNLVLFISLVIPCPFTT